MLNQYLKILPLSDPKLKMTRSPFGGLACFLAIYGVVGKGIWKQVEPPTESPTETLTEART